MKLRLLILLFALFAMPTLAQTDDEPDAPAYAYIHVFNPSDNPFLLGPENDIRQIDPNDSTTFYLPADTPLFINDGFIPLEDTFTVGNRYLFVYVGGETLYIIHDLNAIGEAQAIDASDADTSVWWIANYFSDQSATITISVNDKAVIENLAYGEIAHFYAPITYFMFGATVGDITLFRTDQAFGEPYYTGAIVFSGDPMGRMMRDYFPTTADAIETDFITWLGALTDADIAPYDYSMMLDLIADAGMEADFLADDRVILLPYTDAFLAIPFDVRGYYMNDEARLREWLNNHLLVRSELPDTDLETITTLAGHVYDATLGRVGLVFGGQVSYITKVYLPNNSEVWLIDGVLMPPVDGE